MHKLNRILELVKTMDVPELRRGDFQWLLRSLYIRNSKHPHYNEVMTLIKEQIKLSERK